MIRLYLCIKCILDFPISKIKFVRFKNIICSSFDLKMDTNGTFFFYFCFKIHHVYHNKRSVYLVVLSKRRKGSWSYDILSNFLIYGLVSQESVCLWRSIYLEIYIHINTPDTIEHVLVFSNTSTTFRQTGRFWLWRTFF